VAKKEFLERASRTQFKDFEVGSRSKVLAIEIIMAKLERKIAHQGFNEARISFMNHL